MQGAFLVLELDVIVAGGVSENYLLATTELWDRLLQEFLLFLRANAAPGAARKPGSPRNRCPRRRPNPRPSRRRISAGGAPPASAIAIRSVSAAAASACQPETDHEQHPETAHESPYRRRRCWRRRGGAVLMRGSPAQSSESPRRKPPLPAAAAAPPPACRRSWPRWARCRWIGTSCSASCRRRRRRARSSDNRAGLDQWLRARLAEKALIEQARGAGVAGQAEVKRAFQAAQEQILMQSYLESVSRAPDDYPTEADLASAYERAKPQLAQPALYRVSQIFLPAPLATPRPRPPRASRRRNWSSGPRRPRPISALARATPQDASSREQGGDIGFCRPADAGDAPGGRATQDRRRVGPGAVRRGFHILKLADLRPAGVTPFDQVKGELRAALRSQRQELAARAYLEGLLNAGTVSIDGAALNAAFEQTAAALATGGAVASAKPRGAGACARVGAAPG